MASSNDTILRVYAQRHVYVLRPFSTEQSCIFIMVLHTGDYSLNISVHVALIIGVRHYTAAGAYLK